MTRSLLDHRLIVNVGKGGVGKTILSTAMALEAARRGRRTLLVQLNVKDRVAELLGTPPVGHAIAQPDAARFPHLWAVNIDPQEAMKEYVLLKVKYEVVYRYVFENRVVRYFLRAVPALVDLVMLGKIWYHERETKPDPAGEPVPVWDNIIVDGRATGHALFFLDLPNVMLSAVSSGPVAEEAMSMRALLHDAERTLLNLVTLPEEMPVAEALELAATVENDLGMRVGRLYVNRVRARRFTPDDERLLETPALPDDPDGDATAWALKLAHFEAARHALGTRYLARLDALANVPRVHVPFLFHAEIGVEALADIGRLLLAHEAPCAVPPAAAESRS